MRSASDPPPAGAVTETVAALCDLAGPCGHEQAVARHLAETWAASGARVERDAVGNVLARVGGSGPRVLLQAHMDEIGFVVRHVTDDGFLLLDSSQDGRQGAHERRYMVAQPAAVLGREAVVRGVFAAPSGHVLTQAQRDSPQLSPSDFFVDVGARSAREARERGVHVGAPVIWDVRTQRIGDRLVGKAMDDRALLAAITLLLPRLSAEQLDVELWVAGTVQEENLFHGARALAARERFDAAIALDVGPTSDVPTVDASESGTRLERGPAIVRQDKWVVYDRRLSWALADAAASSGIEHQDAAYQGYGSDGVAFIDAGCRAALLALPTRYTHTAIETIAIADLVDVVQLLEAFVRRPPEAWRQG